MVIFDLHNDILTAGETVGLPEAEIGGYLKNTSGLSEKILAVWTSRLKEPLKFLKDAIKNAESKGEKYFAVEDLFFLEERDLEEFCGLPLAYCTLAWNTDNALSGGHKGKSGLTSYGKKVIKELDRNGIFTDTAHLNERSFYDVLNCAKFIINSHTCFSWIHPHTRNINKDQASALARAGALTAVTMVSDFMGGGSKSRADFLAQILSYADLFGIINLAIGTDFYGTDPIEGLENYKDFDFLRYDLEKHGFKSQDIDRIFFKNALDFINRTKLK